MSDSTNSEPHSPNNEILYNESDLLLNQKQEKTSVTNPFGDSLSLSDFTLTRRLGDGSYSDVLLATHRSSGTRYALKIIDKYHVIKHRVVDQIQRERRLLQDLNDEECTVDLFCTFQDDVNVYLVLEPCVNGELYDQIGEKMSVERIRFYAAEMVVMLDMLRRHEVVHRDIKPENLLLDAEGHLRLIDFGSAKEMKDVSSCEASDERKGRLMSLVGTAEYVAPEVLENRGPVTYGIDLWAFGCTLYQMFASKTPFKGASEYLTFQNIVQHEYDEGPLERGGAGVMDLVRGLLQPDPSKRVGYESIDELKSHSFFKGIHWGELYSEKAPEPVPQTEEERDDNMCAYDWEMQSLAAALPSYKNE